MQAEPPGGSLKIPGERAKEVEVKRGRLKEGKKMDAEVARALAAASRQSAEMAQEAIKMLNKGEKKDGEGFATASKAVRPPDPFAPTGMEEENRQWQDWRLAFKSWVVFAEEPYDRELAGIEVSDTEVKLGVRSDKLHA